MFRQPFGHFTRKLIAASDYLHRPGVELAELARGRPAGRSAEALGEYSERLERESLRVYEPADERQLVIRRFAGLRDEADAPVTAYLLLPKPRSSRPR